MHQPTKQIVEMHNDTETTLIKETSFRAYIKIIKMTNV